ncbi:MAG: NADH-quinone oxidoreductase subunit A [Methylococcaceae bacterium]|nr:NADH-quinone oxidoreductase subunit A [Methylococcaceae bacterium]MCI0666882.1 NADH-quinone oxidoreductase subunit A [Methylococcaceae bacterium]
MVREVVQVEALWPLVFYGVAVLAIVAVMLGGSYLLGHRGRQSGGPFESGIVPAGTSQIQYTVPFYLVAIFFVIFDLEAVFLFAWAIAFRESGWAGYIEILIFIGVLIAALVYLWRIGALDWRTARQKRQEFLRRGGW